MYDKRLFNVAFLGLGFMIVFTAFQTLGNIQKIILDSVKHDDSSFTGDAYTSLAIVYAMMAVGNWVAPSIIGSIGSRISMVIGGATYILFIASFLWPKTWLLYATSALLGLGASLIWTGQGNYLTLNSDSTTMTRNSGVFWALFQTSLLYGNLYVYFAFGESSEIDYRTRTVVSGVLTVVCGIGVLLLMFLRPPVSADGSVVARRVIGPVQAFLEAMRLFSRKEMILLCTTFAYTGLATSFYSGVYSASIASTLNISDNPKRLMGLSGIAIGIGEISGGTLFGILGSRIVRWGRSPVVILGFLTCTATYFLIFINIPNEAPLMETHEEAFIQSSAVLAIICAGLLGFADSCYLTQVMSAIGTIFSEESVPAFAVFKFIQSVAAAIAFMYSNYFGLYVQLGLLVSVAFLSTVTFILTELLVKRRNYEDTDSNSSKHS